MSYKKDFRSSHYSPAFNNKRLSEFAAWAVLNIHENTLPTHLPLLFFRGLSGTVLASAIGSAWYRLFGEDISCMYIGKKEEKAHGTQPQEVHINQSKSKYQIWFVDDFISSGETFNECYRILEGYFDTETEITIPTVICSGYSSSAAFVNRLFKPNIFYWDEGRPGTHKKNMLLPCDLIS